MKRPAANLLNRVLDQYFSSFDSTLALTSDLIRDRKHPNEVLILLCARIDALASDAAAEGTPSKQAFVHFIRAYSGEQDLFDSVSIGDLHYELAYHQWLLEGTIPQPGRLHRFSRVDDPIIQLLEDAGLPLTLDDSGALLATLMRIIKHEFHAVPRQSLSKPRLATIARISEVITTNAVRTRLKKIADNLPKALSLLLESKRVATILYEKFRSGSIHGAKVIIDPHRFFAEKGAYWEHLYSEHYGSFEVIGFSAQFLRSLLDRCIVTYHAHLLAKGKLPPDVLFHVFGDDILSEVEFLDETLLPLGGQVRLRIGGR